MCQYSADDGCANDWHMMHLGMLANSGAALVVVEATHVERHGRITHGCMGLYSDDNELALQRVIAQCRRAGTAKFGIQIAHAGRKASSQRPWEGAKALQPGQDPWPTIAPSPLPWGEGWHVPREATEADLARVREAFVSAAKRALRIGFDEIELHMAHGYLLHGFMSPISNKRTDQYGGSFENRMRFPLAVARAVRAAVPTHIPLGARITGSDWREDGLTPDDAVAISRALKGEGLDFICVSSGGALAEIRTPTDARLQRADRGAREERSGHRHAHRRHDRQAGTGRGDRSQRAGRHGVARRAPSSTTRTGAGMRPKRSARTSRGRCSISAPVPSCGRRRPRRREAAGGMDNFLFLAVLFAAACHAGWNALIKVGLDPLSTTTLIAIGSAVVALVCLPLFGMPAAAAWPWLVASAFIHLLYFAALIEAYRTGDLGQVYPIARGSAPLMTAAASAVFVGEALRAVSWIGIATLAAGVLLLSMRGGRDFAHFDRRAVGFALATALTICAYSVVDGIGARASLNPQSYVLWLLIGNALTLVPYALWRDSIGVSEVVRHFWLRELAGGGLQTLSYGIALWAMTLAPIAIVASLRETSVLFGAAFAVVMLKEPLRAARIVAALLIVCGLVLIRVG